METIEVRDDAANRFYELRVGGQQAGLLVYEDQGSRRVLTHTFIQESFRGRGLVKILIRDSLEDIRARGLSVTNFCGIVDRYIQRHPEYEILIDLAHPGSWAGRPAGEVPAGDDDAAVVGIDAD
ncbi:GNAT family N-acetyltransferase [Rugosimonospora acidiphila]|uniref:GNAT family N-acetyltransferase n=1 Tax=Rugosimonospora acidiphila TaxID=556531 RepID=UPI0031E50A56